MKNTIKVAISGIRIIILLAMAVLAGNSRTSFAAIPNTPTLFYPYNNSTVNGTMISFSWNAVDNVTYYWVRERGQATLM